MLDQLIFLLVASIVSFILYPFWINFVYKYHMGESIRPDGPKAHLVKKGTPTMGGLVFLVTVSVLTLLFNRSRTQTLFPILVTATAGLFGIMEDFAKVYKRSTLEVVVSRFSFISIFSKPLFFITPFWRVFKEFARIVGSSSNRGIQTYQKFLIEATIGGFVAYWAYVKLGWDYIWFPLVGNIQIGVLYPIFIFFLFLAVLNFVAFTDGVDGLAGGLAMIAFAAYWVIASHLEFNSIAALAATFVGALIPFLYFNVYPARIFMGDVGSHVLGASLAIIAVVMHREVAMIFILMVFLVDGISSPLQQWSVVLTKKRIFRMAPFHHHFEMLGWPETKVTLRFWLFGIFFAFLGIFVALL